MTENTQNTPQIAGSGTSFTPYIPPDALADHAAQAVAACDKPFADQARAAAVRDALCGVRAIDSDGETFLYEQARVLDAFFSRCMVAAMDQTQEEVRYAETLQRDAAYAISDREQGFKPAARHPLHGKPSGLSIDADYAEFALRAQSQCIRIVDTLSRVKFRKATNKLKGPSKKP